MQTVNPGSQEGPSSQLSPTLDLPVICLIGSSRFKDTFRRVGEQLEKTGTLALMMSFFEHADNVPVSDKERAVLDTVDRQRIDLANGVLVLNVGGYIGPSTSREIAYAISQGKPVRYLEGG